MRIRPRGSYDHHAADGSSAGGPDEEDPDASPEPVYILDPHDGQLYVFLPEADPSASGHVADGEDEQVDARLQRLPITMEQLYVHLSPSPARVVLMPCR